MSTLSRRRFLAGMSLAALSGILASCGAGAETRSSKARQRSPQASPDDVRAFAAGHNTFGLALYQLLCGNAGNLFFSPYSIAQAFTMVSAGARGNTAKQMAEVLHSAFPQERLHPAANALDLALTSRRTAQDDFQLEVANSIWGQRDYTFRPEFLDLLAENYGAGLRTIDFRSAPEAARQSINGAVAEQTHDKIKDLLPPDSIDAQTALVLANAIYFNAKWQSPFESYRTGDQPFHLEGGGTVTAPLMGLEGSLRYAKTADYQAVALPYQGGVSMLVLLPREGAMADFERGLNAELLQIIQQSLAVTFMGLRLPKFTLHSPSISLRQALTQLGMADAFDEAKADFSGIDGMQRLFLSNAFHQAMVRVDEQGTEAAAATALVGIPASGPPGTQMIVDRPFVFAIQDDPTGALLFMGRIVNPQAG